MEMFAVYQLEYPDETRMYDYFVDEQGALDSMKGREVHYADGRTLVGDEWLGIRKVERPDQPCKSCGGQAQNSPEQYENYPYCRGCHYVGNAGNDIHLNDLSYFRRHFPEADVGIEHTGGGCFWLAFRWEDDKFFYIATDGDASLPESWADGWGFVGYGIEDGDDYRSPGEMGDEYPDDGVLRYLEIDEGEKGLTKQQVVAEIKKHRKSRIGAPS